MTIAIIGFVSVVALGLLLIAIHDRAYIAGLESGAKIEREQCAKIADEQQAFHDLAKDDTEDEREEADYSSRSFMAYVIARNIRNRGSK